MTQVHRSDPLEIRVLETLNSGPLSAAEVAMRTGEAETVVGEVLERSVVEQAVTRIKLTHAPAYSLTPKGMHAIAVHQGAPGVVGDTSQVDLRGAPLVTGEYAAAREVPGDGVPEPPPALPTESEPVLGGLAPSRVGPDSATRRVRWRHLVYAAAYLLLGLFILVLAHSVVVGVLAILAGLGLAAWTLRPLLAGDPTRSDGP